MLSDPRSPAAEAYKTLRTNIQFSSLDKPVRTLLVTSTRPNEGKSLAVANLALTFAQMGNTVALVDADLRRPALHILFGVSNEVGLTNFILNAGKTSNNGRASGQIPFVPSDISNLKLLTSGPLPPNSAEVLGSSRMSELIERLKDEADYVIFDAPPVLALTDAAVLATKVDGTILVLKAGKTSRDDAREAKEQLQKVRANLLGVVLNDVKQGNAKYRY
jgi:non-specific protein-tyrosine kinase